MYAELVPSCYHTGVNGFVKSLSDELYSVIGLWRLVLKLIYSL